MLKLLFEVVLECKQLSLHDFCLSFHSSDLVGFDVDAFLTDCIDFVDIG